MVDVGMCQHKEIDLGGRNRKIRILIDVSPLLHAVVHQEMLPVDIQIVTASCYFMIGADKFNDHGVLLYSLRYAALTFGSFIRSAALPERLMFPVSRT